MGCSLNGICGNASSTGSGAAHQCRCDDGWTGPDCGALNLGPTSSNAVGSGRIYPPPASNTSSWGGGVVFRDGSYHLYVSEMAGHCGPVPRLHSIIFGLDFPRPPPFFFQNAVKLSVCASAPVRGASFRASSAPVRCSDAYR
jgi:hypothetical protein